MSVKSLQGRRTTYATRIKLMKIKVQNTTVKTNESWADSWRYRVLVQIECWSGDCSTSQDQRRRMPDCQDEVWCEGRRGLHELQSGERREWKLVRLVHISPVCNCGTAEWAGLNMLIMTSSSKDHQDKTTQARGQYEWMSWQAKQLRVLYL